MAEWAWGATLSQLPGPFPHGSTGPDPQGLVYILPGTRTFAEFSSSHFRQNFLEASSGSFLRKGGTEGKLEYQSPNS